MRRRPRHPDETIASLATKRGGILGHGEMRAAGISDQQIWYRIRSGRLRRLHRGVYAIAGVRLSSGARWAAALLAAGAGAVLSHRSGGAASGLSIADGARVDVTVAPTGRRSVPGIALHAARLEPEDRATRGGMPVLAGPRLLLSLATLLPARSLERLVVEAAHKGILEPAPLRSLLDRCSGQAGMAKLRLATEGFVDVSRTRSVPEAGFQLLCAKRGIPTPCVNVPVGDREVDFLWPRERVIVEIDGFSAHGHRSRFERDRARAVELRLAGYEYLPFTPRQVDREPDWVANCVLTTLQRRGAA